MTDPAAPGTVSEGRSSADAWRMVAVAGVSLELPGVHPEVLLEERQAPFRRLRIPVGFAEGTAIAYAWRAVATPRPLTHQLLADILQCHGVEVAALRITGKHGATFLAELDTAGPRGPHTVSCRPSDGVALVLRGKLPIPILVAEALLGAEDGVGPRDAAR